MSTIDRLRRMTGEADAAAPDHDERDEKIRQLRSRIRQILERRPERPAVCEQEQEARGLDLSLVAEGMEVSTPFGPVFVSTQKLDLARPRGSRSLGELKEADMGLLALLAADPRLEGLSPRDGLFLDIETTGLAGGTGTFAFLIGLGWLEDDGFVTHLIVARDFIEEPAALSLLADMAGGKGFLVSYNGKAFDAGILATRFILNRLPDPFQDIPHLDLLHPTRRLIGHRLENAKLGTIEQWVLGIHRQEDIPSCEIPQRYFRYLRTRDGSVLREVLEHNRHDIVSMALLTVHLCELLCHGHQAPNTAPSDVVAAARFHCRRGSARRAERLLHGLAASDSRQVLGDCGRELSLLLKRSGKWHEAAGMWRRMLEADPFDLFAAEELAKWLEHRQMRFGEAIEVVERVLQGSSALEEPIREAFLYRLRRLVRKAQGRIV
jgi:uncharacterized protein YprB with RNaseH-like and TPR domain